MESIDIDTRATRRSTAKGITLNAPFKKRKTYGNHGFTHTAASHWNSLPEYSRLARDIRTKETAQRDFFRLAHNT